MRLTDESPGSRSRRCTLVHVVYPGPLPVRFSSSSVWPWQPPKISLQSPSCWFPIGIHCPNLLVNLCLLATVCFSLIFPYTQVLTFWFDCKLLQTKICDALLSSLFKGLALETGTYLMLSKHVLNRIHFVDFWEATRDQGGRSNSGLENLRFEHSPRENKEKNKCA